MTTIAYDHKNKQIAIDSRANANGVIATERKNKIVKNNLGIWFLCGSVCDLEDFVKLTKNDIISKDLDLDASGLRITNGVVSVVYVNDGVFCEYLIDYNICLGSGRDFALAAMDFGKSAREAVKYAMTRDIYTGGKVRVFNVK